jgi:hypothetical protein
MRRLASGSQEALAMHPRRIAASLIVGVVATVGVVGPVVAATPEDPSPSEAPMARGERPLTPAERALSAAKIAAAEAFLARQRTAGIGLVSLSCVPNIAPPGGAKSMPDAKAAPALVPAASCAPPSGFLSVEARQQIQDHYCGPAVGQVVANYAWAMKAGANKFTQGVIAGWMKTDLNGYTNAPELAAGLQRATIGSPRHAANFSWGVTDLRDTDGDGTTADQLHGYLMSAISGARMPVGIPVKPHEPGSSDYLTSWPDPVRSPGHWIAAYGWRGLWDGTASARTYYTDSSGQQGGGTGKYSDPTSEIARMIGAHTRRFVW